jgi:hypothetical protein
MTTMGILTGMLKPEYRALGYWLVEDDDFVYLYKVGVKEPSIFSARGATIASIESHIKELEGVKA